MFKLSFCLTAMLAFLSFASHANAQDLTQWQSMPAQWMPLSVAQGQTTMSSSAWAYLVTPGEQENVEVSATVTIESPATHFGFFGSSWSAWPDPTYGDQGFEAGLLLRVDEKGTRGYRVQISHKLQEVALVRFPDGGYLRSVPCELKTGTPIKLLTKVAGGTIRVSVDGRELIHYVDRLEPAMKPGRAGIGVSSAAKVTFTEPKVTQVEAESNPAPQPHLVNLKTRKWVGGRSWIFDGDEPILLLPSPESSTIINVKLRPGYKPQLCWNSHWDTQNQGAYNEAANTTVDVATSGGGQTLVATWRGKHAGDRFGTKTKMTVSFDSQRGTYKYDHESELEVFAGEPFQFRYGYDFEHHTPLDPFQWQYLIARKRGGELYHRPVYPIDPGPQYDVEQYHGQRVWYGRHNTDFQVAPAVEYEIDPSWNPLMLDDGKTASRTLNTAVCAAFYDTGVAFGSETAKPGTKVRVKYRYTGYPAAEAAELFKASQVYASATLDPQHHYIFADEWPKLTFSQFVPMSETWIYGRTPFMTGHNQRPTYELEKNCGAGSGFAMKLGPASFGKANLPVGTALTKGRWFVSALVKSLNTHGPGGRIELEATQAKTTKLLVTAKHFVGNGTFDWKRTGFVLELPEEVGLLALGLGNSGTGDFLITDVEFKRLADGEAPPAFVASRPNDQPPSFDKAPAGAIADYRMLEGKGHFVFNYATGPLGHLDLANLDWVTDSGRPALRFAENTTGRKDYRADSGLGITSYFRHPSYAGKDTVPLALTGTHGGGEPLKGLTLVAWIKPAPEMGQDGKTGRGEIIGFGARRFILGLHGQQAPYQLAARINVGDVIESPTKLDADRWYHVAMTAEPSAGQWKVRLFLDGKQVSEGQTKSLPSDSLIPPSLILGAEIFYFHSSYYRGLIGRTLVFDRTLTADQISELAK